MSGAPVSASGKSFRSMIGTMYLRMFLPSVVSALALSLANVADALVVGNRVGETGLATIGLATPVYLVYSLLGVGYATGGGITHARLTAAEVRDRALCHCRRLSLELLAVGAAIAVLGNVFLDALLTCLGAGAAEPALRQMCAEYVQPLITAAPLFFLSMLLYYFVRSDDNPVLASVGFSVGSVLDLVLNILFVLVLGWGVRGAVYATIIAQAVSAAVLSFHLFAAKKGILRLKALITARAQRSDVTASCGTSRRTGFSSSLSYLFQFLFMLLSNHLLIAAGVRGRIDGAQAVAVFDLVMNCSFVMVAVYQAAAEALSPLAATFSVEHDDPSLRFVLGISALSGLIPGLVLACVLGFLAEPVAVLFGLTGEGVRAMAGYALRVFMLSTPLSGLMLILISFDQSTERVKFAALATFLRTGAVLLPVTLLLGLFCPAAFWWLFPVTEGLSLAVMLLLRTYRFKTGRTETIPVLTRTITNDNRELGSLLEAAQNFCAENNVPAGTSAKLQLAVEELCAVTILQAFSGKPGEYIRVMLAVEPGPRYILHIRNSAPYFNPMDMKMAKVREDMSAELMDSIGVMMVRRQAKDFSFRNYQGYNVITVEY